MTFMWIYVNTVELTFPGNSAGIHVCISFEHQRTPVSECLISKISVSHALYTVKYVLPAEYFFKCVFSRAR